MSTATEDLWDDLFHACAWAAYLEVWHRTGQFPPDSETTRRLAYRYYEDALAGKNCQRTEPAVADGKPLTIHEQLATVGP
jgi:hypothetical protein